MKNKKNIIVFCILFAINIFANDKILNIKKIGEWGTGVYDNVILYKKYAFCIAGTAGIDILDISNPNKIVKIGNIDTHGNSCDIKIKNDFAFVIDLDKGFFIFDIHNVKKPLMTYHNSDSEFKQIKVFIIGNYVYLGLNSLVVINISNPRKPLYIGSYGKVECSGLFIKDQYAFCAQQFNGMIIADISEIKEPKILYEITKPNFVVDVIFVKDNFAFLVNRNSGLRVMDVSTPATPKIINEYNFGVGYNLFYKDDRLYITDFTIIDIVDISNPLEPKLLGKIATKDSALGIYVDENIAYIANRTKGLQLFDVTNPALANFTGKYDYSGYALDVYVEGDYAYLNHENVLNIIDVKTPQEPTLVGSIEIDHLGHYAVVGKHAYITSDSNGLQIYDVSSPNSPKVVGELKTNKKIYDCKYFNNKVYLALEGAELQIIDVVEPMSPKLLGNFFNNEEEKYLHLSMNDKYLFADFEEGFDALDVTNPGKPSLVKKFEYDYPIKDDIVTLTSESFTVNNQFALLGDGSELFFINIKNISSPKIINKYFDYESILDIFIENNFAYFARGHNGVKVFNIANPEKIKKVAAMDIQGSAEKVFIKGDYVYVADKYSGKLIIAKKPKIQ